MRSDFSLNSTQCEGDPADRFRTPFHHVLFCLYRMTSCIVFQEPPHSYSSVDSDEDTPGSTLQPYTRTSSKSLAVWDANAAAASPALNTNDGGEYGSTAAPITSRDGLDASSEEDIGTGEGAAARDLQTTSGAVEESGGTAKCGGTCLGNITYPLRVCLFGCFVNKLVTEVRVVKPASFSSSRGQPGKNAFFRGREASFRRAVGVIREGKKRVVFFIS